MEIEIISRFKAGPEQVAKQTLLMDGVNRELSPWIKMTCPHSMRSIPIERWPVEKPLFNSIILLFGFLPIDRHKFYFRIVSPTGFSEDSSTLLNRHWRHTRQIKPHDKGTELVDTLEFEAYFKPLEYFLRPVYLFVFKQRHKRLERIYN